DRDSEFILDTIQKILDKGCPETLDAILTDMQESIETFIDSIGFDELLQDVLKEKLDLCINENIIDFLPQAEIIKEADVKEIISEMAIESTVGEAKQEDIISQSETEFKKEVEDRNSSRNKEGKTVRIAEDHIDQFLEYVGELLVVGDMFQTLQKTIIEKKSPEVYIPAIREANDTFSNLSENLQRSIMSIRKVSTRSLLQKSSRIVRDIAMDSNKLINVTIEGERLTIDKNYLDILDAPIVHMVRNAADHGIEMPGVREAAGKAEEGTIRVSIQESNQMIELIIEDDGAGLDYDKIQAKAVEMGIAKKDTTLTEQQIIDFLFVSGVSTAEKTTDVSGRGVGMDVVKHMIEDAGGTIAVNSERGKGSRFSIKLPQTIRTQIIEGFLIRINDNVCILPMDKVKETLKVDVSKIKSVTGRGECLVIHDKLHPILDLHKILDLPRTYTSDERIIVRLLIDNKFTAIHVDEVLGVKKVVQRTISGINTDMPYIKGGALMSDGTVALILDLDNLLVT
ncbi:MAG: chemotaxis protein CheW, partial [Lentisphaeria bacterium]|nr:chemotaxis protein CheW [Lentisphaeria bacterium]